MERKTKKAISRSVQKLVKKHGPEIAAGLATAAVTAIINSAVGTDGDGNAGGKKKKKKKKDKQDS